MNSTIKNAFGSKTTPKVSVCCTAYNHGKYIRQALESIFAQKTDFPFEVIVHDDASTDETAHIIKEFEKNNSNMQAIYQEENQFSKNIGSLNVSFTLPLAQGEYVIINEGDDFFMDPLKLQKQVDFLDAHPECALCFHPVKVFYENGSQPDSVYPLKVTLEGKDILTLEDLLKVNFIQTNSCMYRWAFKGEKIKAIVPKDIMPVDYFLHIIHAMRGDIGFIDEVMAAYRKHSESLWAAQAEENTSGFYLKYGSKIYKFYTDVENMVGAASAIVHTTQTFNLLQILINEYINNERLEDIQYIFGISNNIPEVVQSIASAAISSSQKSRQTSVELAHTSVELAQTSMELAQVSSALQNILHSRSWRITKPLRACAQYGNSMYKLFHTFLLRVIMCLCLFPASFFYGGKGWLKKILNGKLFFVELLENYKEIVQQFEGRNVLIRRFVTAPLCLAENLYRTRSFKQTLRRVFSTLVNTGKQSSPKIDAYVEAITKQASQKASPDFVPLTQEQASFDDIHTKLIAFYLPQFHTFPLNDEWYGKGFTEWTNVTKAIPQYTDHYQPQLPIDMGFYDLNDINVMKRQVELAKLYGLHGFCFHYYWFSGTKLMDMPLFNWLKHQEIDFPFCLNWANENWTKLWDGGNREVRYKQELRDGDDEKFFIDMLPFLRDYRYIKVDGKPVVIVYRPHLFEKERCRAFMSKQREMAKNYGFEGLLLISVNSHGFREDPRPWGLDAMLEFPPHCLLEQGLQGRQMDMYVSPYFQGNVWDGKEYIENRRYIYNVHYKLFKGVCPSWDNTPRKAYSNGSVIDCITPELYKKWLEECIEYTSEKHAKKEQFVFINAWNEWAEGAHLEPDSRYGYAYLQATKEALLKKMGQPWEK